MRRYWSIAAIGILILGLLSLVSCFSEPVIYSVSDPSLPLATPVGTSAQLALEAALTLESSNADDQAVATAVIMFDNAQATMYYANATLNAAQTQEQGNSNVIAAQIAATAEVARANAQSTLVSAGSTQNAAMTQDAIIQTQVRYYQQGTEVAGTQNAMVANNIATQTQAALATSQWYADQERQRTEQWQASIASLWKCCFPVFLVLVAGMVVWGIWTWLPNRQASQPVLDDPVEEVQDPEIQVIHHRQEGSLPGPDIEEDVPASCSQPGKPDAQVRSWLDEVKRKLLNKERQDENHDD